MAIQTATITEAGEIPFPAERREQLGIRPGSSVRLIVKDGRLISTRAG